MDHQKELEGQLSLALAALGLSFARVLHASDVPPRVLNDLKAHAETMHRHLLAIEADQAALMFLTFVRSLSDPKLFPPAD